MLIRQLPILSGATPIGGNAQVLGARPDAIGDKARMLRDHAAAIATAGFLTTPRVIIAHDQIDAFLRANGIEQPVGREIDIMGAQHLPPALGDVSSLIRDVYGEGPAILRSTASKDARGTGAYSSFPVLNIPERIEEAFPRVVSTFFSYGASAWRARVGAGAECAVMIEPLVCESMTTPNGATAWAPCLSGMGYSRSGIGEGFIKISYGLGGGAGVRLTRAVLDRVDYSAQRYCEVDVGRAVSKEFFVMAVCPQRLSGFVTERQNFASRYLRGITLRPIVDGLAALDAQLGNPVYVEWAITRDDTTGAQQNWLLQLAVVPPQDDIWEFGALDAVLLEATDVRRGRDLDLEAIVVVHHKSELEALAAFNATHSAYLLIYGPEVMGSLGFHEECPLTFHHISNAAMLMFSPVRSEHRQWEEHLRGLAEEAGIMIGLGQLAKDDSDKKYWARVRRNFDQVNGLPVYRRPLRVRYSSSKREAVVVPRDARAA